MAKEGTRKSARPGRKPTTAAAAPGAAGQKAKVNKKTKPPAAKAQVAKKAAAEASKPTTASSSKAAKIILARANETTDFNFDKPGKINHGQTGALTVRFELQEDEDMTCGYFLEAFASLKLEGEARATNIGNLITYIVDKDIEAETEADAEEGESKKLWIEQLLDPELEEEISTTFRTLYDEDGDPRSELADYWGLLEAKKMLFIDTLKLKDEKYRGTGLAQAIMKSFHRLLPRLTQGHSFEGTIVLSPAASEDYIGNSDKTPADVEPLLIRSYEKSGYEVWVRGDANVEGSVTVMGRSSKLLDDERE